MRHHMDVSERPIHRSNIQHETRTSRACIKKMNNNHATNALNEFFETRGANTARHLPHHAFVCGRFQHRLRCLELQSRSVAMPRDLFPRPPNLQDLLDIRFAVVPVCWLLDVFIPLGFSFNVFSINWFF